MTTRLRYFFMVLCAALFLQGCVAKKYTRPEYVKTDDVYREGSDTAYNFSEVNWKEFYTDPHLLSLIDRALNDNADIQIAESNIRAAEEYLKQAKAAFYPGVGVGVNAGVTAFDNNGNLDARGSFSSLFQTIYNGTAASWEIDIWGKLASAKRAQKATLMQSEAYYNLVKTELVAAVAGAYYALLAYDAQLRIYEVSAQTREESLTVLKALKESAQTNEVAVNQGAAQYYYAMSQIPQLKMQIQMTENLIAVLLGTTPQEIERGALPDAAFAEADFLKIGIPGDLLVNRPDVMAAEYQLISAHENWNYSRAAMYPSLTISGQAGFSSSQFAEWFAFPASFVGNLIGGITAPIFDHRRLKTQRNVAEQQKIQAALNFKDCLNNAQREIADAYISYKMSGESIEYQIQQVGELNNAVNGSMELLKSGYASYLDLLYAEDNALTASIGLVNYYLQNAKSKIELYRALGGGWK